MLDPKTVLSYWDNYLHTKSNSDYTTLYIHIPFCLQRCRYCLYQTNELKDVSDVDRYLDRLENEILFYREAVGKLKIQSIYLGGGTASILTIEQLKRLENMLHYYFDIEISNNQFTIECHPKTLTTEKINYLASSIWNRLSVGAQTFCPQILEKENRASPDMKDFTFMLLYIMEAYKHRNYLLNVDLMTGLKEQTIDILANDFNFLSVLNIPKITIYPKRINNDHTEENEIMLLESREQFIRPLLSRIPLEKYDYEAIDGYEFEGHGYDNTSFYQFVRKDFSFAFEKIYVDKPGNFEGCINTNLGLGDRAYSWIRTDECYINHDFSYVASKQFYHELESMKLNLRGYKIESVRKRISS